jgi:hypothetical protein
MKQKFGVKVITFKINRNVFIDQFLVVNCMLREGWSVCLSSPDDNREASRESPTLVGTPQKKPLFSDFYFYTYGFCSKACSSLLSAALTLMTLLLASTTNATKLK